MSFRSFENKNWTFRGSFDKFLSKYFGEMEKMESFKDFETLFLNSKMDKNKCPIFIFKKEFQKTKTPFFYVFFSTIFLSFLYDKW